MTLPAVGSERAVMMIVFLVTCVAIGRSSLVNIVGMATGTGGIDMRTG